MALRADVVWVAEMAGSSFGTSANHLGVGGSDECMWTTSEADKLALFKSFWIVFTILERTYSGKVVQSRREGIAR